MHPAIRLFALGFHFAAIIALIVMAEGFRAMEAGILPQLCIFAIGFPAVGMLHALNED